MPFNEEWATVPVTVVEDDAYAQDVILRAARSWHYECQAASSAEQALELLDQRPTPIVVTDLRMPGRGGVWLVQEIRRRWPDVNIIIVTAGHDLDTAIECLNAGAHHFFLKPFRLEELRHALEMTRRSYELQQENKRYRLHLEQAIYRQTRRMRRTFLSAIDSLVRTLEERDPYTADHSLRVRHYSLRLAKALGLDSRQRKQLSLAAKLHDIGKVGIAEVILNKQGSLTAEEHDIVRGHPVIGERILTPIIRNRAVLAAIRSHHERLDGQGYPDGLQGEQIPLLARIITIADCYDALTSRRAYRRPLTAPDALAVLRDGAGTQFEPGFVRTFIKVKAYSLAEDCCPS